MPSDSSSTRTHHRRTFLGAVTTGTAALAGCSTVDGLLGDGVAPAERRIPADWAPDPGDWPTEHYGFGRTNHNPFASPPRSEPTVDWSMRVGDAESDVTAVIVADGRVYATDGESLVVANASDGGAQGRYGTTGGSTLQYVSPVLYVGSSSSLTALYDRQERWAVDFSESDMWAHVFVERTGRVFVFGANETLALHADTGEILERLDPGLFHVATDGGPIYGGFRSFSAYDVAGGELERRWENDYLGYETTGLPTAADGLVYRGGRQVMDDPDSPRTRLAVYDANRGGVRSTVPFEYAPRTPAVADGTAYVATADIDSASVGSGGRLVAITHDGQVRWQFDPEAGLGSPVVADGTVYVGPSRGSNAPLVALDAATGDELWRRSVDGSPELAVADETLYVSDGDEVLALRA